MLSNGGTASVETACRFPMRLLESGPAAGALAAAFYGQESGFPEVLSFDMGGTTAKACVVDGGEPLTSNEFEVARVYRFKKGSGLAGEDVGDRDDRDRGRRWLHRPRRRARLAQGRTRERRRRSGTGLLRPRRRGADRDRRRPAPGVPRSRTTFSAGGWSWIAKALREGDERRSRVRSTSTPWRRRGASTRSSTRTWRTRRASTPSSAARTRGGTCCSPSAGPDRCTPTASPAPSASPASSHRSARGDLGLRFPVRPVLVRSHPQPLRSPGRPRLGRGKRRARGDGGRRTGAPAGLRGGRGGRPGAPPGRDALRRVRGTRSG